MDSQTIAVIRSRPFLQDMRPEQISPDLSHEGGGWYKSTMRLEFDGAPVGSVVEQWLSRVRGALRDPDSRVLLIGCMKKNVDQSLVDHPRIVWWESHGKSDNKRATDRIPSRVHFIFAMKWIRHSLLDAVKAQADKRGIGMIPMISPADTTKLLRLGFMEGSELERRLRPAIPSPIASLMREASPLAVASTKTIIAGQIHKIVKGDDVPAPLEPERLMPPILDPNGDPIVKQEAEAPVKKKRVIVNKHVGPVQRVLMQHADVALDRTLSRAERARRLIDKCREAGLTKTSENSLSLAVAQFEAADDKQKAEAARVASAPAPVETAAPVPAAPAVEPVADAPAAATATPPAGGAIAQILSLVEDQSAQLKLAEEHVALARVAQIQIAETVSAAIAEARGEARKALEATLRNMGIS